MSQINISWLQWRQTFQKLGWNEPLPQQTWQRLGGGKQIQVEWNDILQLIHSIGWSDQHAQMLWAALPVDTASSSLAPASWWARAAGSCVDGLVLVIPVAVITGLGWLAANGTTIKQKYSPSTHLHSFDLNGSAASAIPVVLVALLVPLAYNYWLMNQTGPTHGQTIGKRMFKTRAVSMDGLAISKPAIIIRLYAAQGIVWLLGSLLMVAVLGFGGVILALLYALLWWVVCPMVDQFNRCPHDFIAQTRPVQA